MAKDSHYDQSAADYAVGFIECLCHTKGTWAGKPFELIDWQEQIIRDVFGDVYKRQVQWLIEQSKLPFDSDMIVVDELSSFKNHQSKRFKALMQVRPRIKRVVGLTGTPASNGLKMCIRDSW